VGWRPCVLVGRRTGRSQERLLGLVRLVLVYETGIGTGTRPVVSPSLSRHRRIALGAHQKGREPFAIGRGIEEPQNAADATLCVLRPIGGDSSLPVRPDQEQAAATGPHAASQGDYRGSNLVHQWCMVSQCHRDFVGAIVRTAV
jgi:hypothetical protein